MNRLLILVLLVCFTLAGCNQDTDDIIKGEFDIKGSITEVETDGKRILVEDQDKGLVWISLPKDDKIENYKKGQTVSVWTDGQIRESYPLQATGLKIEIVTD